MITAHDAYADNWDYDPGFTTGQGSTHQVSSDGPEQDEKVNELRKVVEEVTRKPLPKAAPKAKMGFY